MKNKKIIKILLTFLLLAYLIILFYLVFVSPYYGRHGFYNNFNIIPFRTIIKYLNYSQSREVVTTNILGNILAFLPLGILLPLLFRAFRKFYIAFLPIFLATLLIEVIQYITFVGIADIDDVILNLAGGILGFFVFKIVWKSLKNRV